MCVDYYQRKVKVKFVIVCKRNFSAKCRGTLPPLTSDERDNGHDILAPPAVFLASSSLDGSDGTIKTACEF